MLVPSTVILAYGYQITPGVFVEKKLFIECSKISRLYACRSISRFFFSVLWIYLAIPLLIKCLD